MLVDKLQELWTDLRNLGQRVNSTKEDLQQRQSSQAEQTERLLRSFKRQNILVVGVAESASLYTPSALTEHVSQLLSEGAPHKVAVSTAFRLGKWRSDQKGPRAVLVELQAVADKHCAFKGSRHLREKKIRLDDNLTPQQMQQRRGLSSDFLCLKVRGYKPFFRGATLKYRDGAAV